MTCTIEVLCIGNELLIGKILNTNAQWLARYVSSLGGNVKRVNTIGDDLNEISSALLDSLSRKPTFIITTGGLGPTFDDKTLEAIANSLNKPIVLNEEALSMVKEKYHQYEAIISKKLELTPARLKMASLPEGSKPLQNPVGTAPGVLLKYDSSQIIALPGVPKEMEAIFEISLAPMIKAAVGNVFTYEKSLNVFDIIESELAPLIDKTMHDNPYVYIKSHPKAAEPIPLIELHLTATSELEEKAQENVEKAAKQISQLILQHAGKIESD
ncbi:MAG: hypothetical protein QG670_1672 [Thermoproteota archaeon]|nr:hypothetical protein [Thermoproteota archaeon]